VVGGAKPTLNYSSVVPVGVADHPCLGLSHGIYFISRVPVRCDCS
jgi:hypothetical protein